MAKRTAKRRTVSPKALRNFILKEAKKLQREALSGKLDPIEKVKAEEYEAGEEGQQLEKDIDHIKALKIHERRLKHRMKKIQEAKAKLRKRIVRKL